MDLDGTLTPVDTQVEPVVRLFKHEPWQDFRMVVRLLAGRAALERRIADLPMSTQPNRSSESSGVTVLDEYLKANFRELFMVGIYRVMSAAPESRSAAID